MSSSGAEIAFSDITAAPNAMKARSSNTWLVSFALFCLSWLTAEYRVVKR